MEDGIWIIEIEGADWATLYVDGTPRYTGHLVDLHEYLVFHVLGIPTYPGVHAIPDDSRSDVVS